MTSCCMLPRATDASFLGEQENKSCNALVTKQTLVSVSDYLDTGVITGIAVHYSSQVICRAANIHEVSGAA